MKQHFSAFFDELTCLYNWCSISAVGDLRHFYNSRNIMIACWVIMLCGIVSAYQWNRHLHMQSTNSLLRFTKTFYEGP